MIHAFNEVACTSNAIQHHRAFRVTAALGFCALAFERLVITTVDDTLRVDVHYHSQFCDEEA